MTTQVALVMAPLLPWIRSTGVENMGWKYGGGGSMAADIWPI